MSKLTTQICIEIPTKEGIRHALQVFYQEYLIAHPYASSAVLLTWAMYPDYPFRAIYTIFYAWPSAVLRGLLSCLGVGEEGAPQRSYIFRHRARHHQGYLTPDGAPPQYQAYGATSRGILEQEVEEEEGLGLFWLTLRCGCVFAALFVLFKLNFYK